MGVGDDRDALNEQVAMALLEVFGPYPGDLERTWGSSGKLSVVVGEWVPVASRMIEALRSQELTVELSPEFYEDGAGAV